MKSHVKRSEKSMVRIAIFVVMLCVFVSSIFSVSAFSREFTIRDGDRVLSLQVISSDTNKILERAGIALGPNDIAVKNDVDATVTIKRAFEATVNVDGYSIKGIYNDGTVGYALKKSNVSIRTVDKVSPALTEPLTPDLQIKVTRYHEVILRDHSKDQMVTVPYGTIKNALDYLKVSLGSDDTLNVPLDMEVEEGMTIKISRVGYHEQTIAEAIPFTTSTIQTDTLPLGETRIKTAGVNGQQVTTILQKYVNGELVESTEKSKIITVQPIEEVVLIGTAITINGTGRANDAQKVKGSSSTASLPGSKNDNVSNSSSSGGGTFIDHNGKTTSYKSVITGTATAYTAGPGAITSTGRPAQRGYVAVDPKVIPYGTKLYICSPDGNLVYGYALAADTGGAMLNGDALVDLYYDTEEECWQFGRREMCVYILE